MDSFILHGGAGTGMTNSQTELLKLTNIQDSSPIRLKIYKASLSWSQCTLYPNVQECLHCLDIYVGLINRQFRKFYVQSEHTGFDPQFPV